jgi:hypothetical protein
MRAHGLIAFLSLFSLLNLLPSPARACSVCGCDPAAGTLGFDRPSAQSVRVGLEDRYLSKESGAADDAESEREDRLTLRAQYSPIAPLVFQLEVPWFIFKNHLNALGVQDDNATGLGDLAVSARYELLRMGLDARHVLALTGTLKLPTGPNDRLLPGATDPDEHTQLGTGTWDGIAGLTYLWGLQPWTVYANLSGRLNSANSRGFRYGNAVFGTLGVRRNFLDTGRLIASLEAQVRNAGMDHRGDGTYDPDSGGFIGYASGSVGYAVTQDLLFRVIAQVPAVTALNGVQSEHPVLYAALSYDFNFGM